MKIELTILNTEKPAQWEGATWHSRRKAIESDWIDEEIVDLAKGHKLDRLTISDMQIGSRATLELVIQMLENARAAFEQTEPQPETIRSAPVRYPLDTVLAELKFGRTAEDQKFLDECIEKLQRS